jgi:hypothetical protein
MEVPSQAQPKRVSGRLVQAMGGRHWPIAAQPPLIGKLQTSFAVQSALVAQAGGGAAHAPVWAIGAGAYPEGRLGEHPPVHSTGAPLQPQPSSVTTAPQGEGLGGSTHVPVAPQASAMAKAQTAPSAQSASTAQLAREAASGGASPESSVARGGTLESPPAGAEPPPASSEGTEPTRPPQPTPTDRVANKRHGILKPSRSISGLRSTGGSLGLGRWTPDPLINRP